jgi:osmoprotectant transport system substrate-binding protein
MRLNRKGVVGASALLSVAIVATACGSSGGGTAASTTTGGASTTAGSATTASTGTGGSLSAPAGAPAITIGGANFSESTLVANIYGDALKKAGFSVTVKSDLGAREVIQPALESGKLNMVIDYAGNLLAYYNSAAPSASGPATAAALVAYLSKKGLKASTVSSAADADSIAVNSQTETKYHLTTISQLAPIAGQLTFGGPPECATRSTCLPGLKSVYGVVFKSFKQLDAAGPITIAALKDDQIQVARLDSSDPSINADKFTVLSDPKSFQASGALLPEFSTKIDSPQLEAVLNQVSAAITTQDLVTLNGEISSSQTAPATVAASFVASKNLG